MVPQIDDSKTRGRADTLAGGVKDAGENYVEVPLPRPPHAHTLAPPHIHISKSSYHNLLYVQPITLPVLPLPQV
jgi:hypothetical protein